MLELTACIVTYRNNTKDVENAAFSFDGVSGVRELLIVDNSESQDYFSQLPSERSKGIAKVQADFNGGFGKGHNSALKKLPKSRYHLVLNPDVIIHPNTLEKMIAYMDENPDIALLGPKILNEDGSIQKLNKRLATVFDLFVRRFTPNFIQKTSWVNQRMLNFCMEDQGYDEVCDVPYMSGCFMLFRRGVLDEIHGFDERFFLYMEDADISRRASEKGRVVFYPETTVTHKWARGSHKSKKLTWISIVSTFKYFNKWGWKFL